MYLVCYDISQNTLRNKIAQKLLREGFDRINKSVYLSSIDESSLKSLVQWLSAQMQDSKQPTDSLLIIPLTAGQVQRMAIFGLNELDKDELTGNKSTLIL